MQSGELIVTEKNNIHIPLDNAPAEVKVHFKDECEMVPCNPHDVDLLEFFVKNFNDKFVLVIRWSVSGVREIKWQVFY